jgi:ABC-type amino acid transport substrate-binding protein
MTRRIAFALALLLFAGLASAEKLKMIYWPSYGMTVHDNVATFHVEITEKETGRLIATKDFDVVVNAWKVIDVKDGARDITLRARGQADGSGEMIIIASENGERIQLNAMTFTPKPKADDAHKANHEPISLNLKDADLENVLNVFGQLTGYDVSVNDAVKGKKVTIEVMDMPWDQALRKIASDAGITITIGDKKIFADR